MSDNDKRKSATENPCVNPTSASKPVESEGVEPLIPDWIFKVVEIRAKQPSIHQKQSQEQQTEDTNSLVDRIRRSDRWMIVLTAIIAIATFLNVVVFFLESRSSSQQTENIIITAKRMAESLEETVKRNKLILDEYRQAGQLDQRAWISVKEIATTPVYPEAGKSLRINVTFTNSGKTPAKGVIGKTVVDPVPEGRRPNFSYGKDIAFQSGYMPPNGDRFVTLIPTRSKSTGQEGPLTPELLNILRTQKLHLYVHGRIDYHDIFKKPHWITFCYFWRSPEFNSFGLCDRHNDSDDIGK